MFTVTTSLLRCRAISIVVASSKRPPPLRRMSFHFASTEYARCFVDLPQPDTAALRKQTIDYLDSFDSQLWYTDPVRFCYYLFFETICSFLPFISDRDHFHDASQMVSILNGSHLSGSTLTDTENALGQVNGTQALASPEQVEMIKQHIRSFESPYTDLRMQMRNVEQSLLNRYAGFLIGNQCLDFQKQDGITEASTSTGPGVSFSLLRFLCNPTVFSHYSCSQHVLLIMIVHTDRRSNHGKYSGASSQ